MKADSSKDLTAEQSMLDEVDKAREESLRAEGLLI